jgi:dTDP-4-dehydrorhamnose reductase
MKCLVIGASGQVGGHLLASGGRTGWTAVGTCFRNVRPGLLSLDLRDGDAVRDVVRQNRPDVVFLPAAMTHVDHGETHPQECLEINVAGTRNVARAVRDHGGSLVFFSTEHVFAGGMQAYFEDSPRQPMNVYAKSKVEGEDLVRALLPGRHLILRTSWVYGPEEQRKNFVYRCVRTLREQTPLIVPEDQFGQPTYSPDLADAAWRLVEQGGEGTFHVVGPEPMNRLDFARRIAGVFQLDARHIHGVASASLRQPAARPLLIKLGRDKLLSTLGRDPIRSPTAGLPAVGSVDRTFFFDGSEGVSKTEAA